MGKEIEVYEDYYFKATAEEGAKYISGMPLPKVVDGVKFRFVKCTFHPALHEELENKYADAEYINCSGVPRALRESKRTELTEEMIREANPHFGPEIRVIEEGPYESECGFDFDYFIKVGAKGSKIDFSLKQDGSYVRTVDAHAVFLWSPSEKRWVLGAN